MPEKDRRLAIERARLVAEKEARDRAIEAAHHAAFDEMDVSYRPSLRFPRLESSRLDQGAFMSFDLRLLEKSTNLLPPVLLYTLLYYCVSYIVI
jgi:hypothetical protein